MRRLTISLALILCLGAAAAPLDLSRPALVIPQNSLKITRIAAAEFQEHMRLITGEAPRIFTEDQPRPDGSTATVWFGRCNRAKEVGLTARKLREFEFVIRRQGDELFLFGNDQTGNPETTTKLGALTVSAGTLFAVYDFLDRELGVRHIWPGPLGTVVRHDKNPKIDDIPERCGGHWAAASLFWSKHYPGAPQWEGSREFFAAQKQWLWRQRFCESDRGVFSTHSFKKYWKRFHADHPGFFAMLPNGERRPLVGDAQGTRISMCVSDPALIRQIAADYRETFADEKTVPSRRNSLQVGENDSPGMCTCPACRAWDAPEDGRFATHPYWSGRIIPTFRERFPLLNTEDGSGASTESPSLSDRYCRFYLAVQQEARKINPAVRICGFAYANYARPPRHVKLNDGILITLVNWSNFPFTEERMKQSADEWDRWNATGAKLVLRPNSTHNGHNMPIFYGRKLGNAFLHAQKHGAIAVSFDSLIGQWGAQSASYYCLGRLNARPDLTVEQVLEEYYSAFGPASGKIRAFVEYLERVSDGVTVEKMQEQAKKLGLKNRLPGGHKDWLQAADAVFTPEFFAVGTRMLKEAEEAAKADPEALARVRFLQIGFEHAKRTFDVLLISRTGDREALLKAQRDLLAYRQTIAGEMTSDLGYLRMRERGGSGWYKDL